MRLNRKEINAITEAFNSCLQPRTFTLFLFGSRTDDLKKGGDIDLLVIVPAADKEHVVSLKTSIKNNIFKKIPEQKIDITVATEEEMTTDTFLIHIKPSCIPL